MYFDTKNKAECCGCTACMNACPTSAISMKEDVEGFQYPAIDEAACIHCNLCRKVCCWENALYNNASEPVTLASVLKDKEERQKSTSGGVFYAIAEWVISQGGIVYGAAFDEKLELHHIGVQSVENLQKLRGSKYIQSNLDGLFKDVKKQLDANRLCCFSGTGCQVAGLKSYLRKDYPNLVTIDVICHGVPNQKLFNQHISYLERKYQDKVVNYQFRDNTKGIGCEICTFENRKMVINPSYDLSPYLYAFIHGYISRYSCYDCKFARIPRQGDISLGDYWGVKYFIPQINNENGVSLVIINTEKGKIILEKISEKCEFHCSNVRDASKHNGSVVHPNSKPDIRDTIFKRIEEKGYTEIAKSLFRSPDHLKLSFLNRVRRTRIVEVIFSIYHHLKYNYKQQL